MKKQTFFTIALMFAAAISNAQTQYVPNGTFENWSSPNGYNEPDDWGTLNSKTSTAGVYTATRGGSVSDYYLKLTSTNVSGMGVIPGIAVSGMLDMNNFTAVSGYSFAEHPTSFSGKWQYMGGSGSDNGSILVYLTKWNTVMNKRDTVGYVEHNLSGMAMSWANFSLPITYNSSATPDSCVITLNASGTNPAVGSYLYVDNLNFSGITTGITENSTIGTFAIFPNPAQNQLNVNLSGLKTEAQRMEIIDYAGKLLLSVSSNGTLTQTINIEDLAVGFYLLNIYTSKGVVNQKISKQ